MISAILFDKDGTLVDFDRTWGPAIHATMTLLAHGDPDLIARQAQALDYDLERRWARPGSPLIAGSTATYADLWARALRRTDIAALAHEIDAHFLREGVRHLSPIDDPRGVARRLAARGVRLGIATNDSEAAARAQAEGLGLSGLMDFIAGYDSGFGSKPDPGMVLAFARHTGLPPRSVALVGDSLHDLHAARAAGAVGVAVLSGPSGQDRLAAEADHVVRDIGLLPDLVAALSRAG